MISGVGHMHGAYNDDDSERKRRRYCDKHNNDGEHIDDNDNGEAHVRERNHEKRSSYYKKSLRNFDNYNKDDEEIDYKNNEKSMDKNYNCHYKIKSVPMSAIRCRLDEQQKHYHHHQHERILLHQQSPQLEIGENVSNSDTEHTVINLARSNTMLECSSEEMLHNQNHPHLNYVLSGHTSHAYTGTQHQHYAHGHALKHHEDETELTTTHYSRTPTPKPRTLTVSTVLKSESNSITTASIPPLGPTTPPTSSVSAAEAAAAAAASRRDHNIDYSTLFVQLSGTLPTLYRCVNCNKIVSNRWHHANIHRPQSHVCPVCGQKFTRRDNMKAHCKIKHADIKDRFFSHYVHM